MGRRAIFTKTDMCTFFVQGRCARGEACEFAHGKEQLQQRPDLYKTQLCVDWLRTDTCRTGTLCRFAHGSCELRAVPGGLQNGQPHSSVSGTTSSDNRTDDSTNGFDRTFTPGKLGTTRPSRMRCDDALPSRAAFAEECAAFVIDEEAIMREAAISQSLAQDDIASERTSLELSFCVVADGTLSKNEGVPFDAEPECSASPFALMVKNTFFTFEPATRQPPRRSISV